MTHTQDKGGPTMTGTHRLTRGVLGVAAMLLGLTLATAVAAQAPGELTIGVGRDIPLNTHISVALAKGFLRAEGLPNAQIKSFPSGAVMTESVAAKELQLGLAAITAPVILRNNGVGIVLLAQVADNGSNNALLVRTDANVRKPEDLYRLKLGLQVGSSATKLLNDIAKEHRLDPARLQTVNLTPPDAVAAYRGGQVDGLVVWEPWVGRAEAARPTAILHTYHESLFPEARRKVSITQSAMVLFCREEFARTRTDTLNALLRAMVRADEYIADRAHADEVLAVASRDIKQEPQANRRGFERAIFKLVIDEGLVRVVKENTEFLKETGKIRTVVEPLSWIYSEPLKRARAASVKVDGTWKP